ncbi:MAG: F0F1 ATP synthase subunit A [Myxococcota bacterium]
MASPDSAEAASSLPEHWSWFSLLPESASAWTSALGAPFNDHGEKWFFGGHVDALHVFGFVFVLLILLAFGLATSSRMKNPEDAVLPEAKLTVPTFVELFAGGVYGAMVDMMGKKAAKFFLPLIGTCAFVIFFSNVLGLIPGFLPPTDNLNTTAAMAIVIFFATHIFGIKEQGFGNYIKHFMGPIWWLAPLIFIIEVISHLVRPVTLAVRLTANMFADHAVLTAFLGLIAGGLGAAFASGLVTVPVYILGCVVVTVQTLVFTLLSMVYISRAIEHHDHH